MRTYAGLTSLERFWSKVAKVDSGCWEWQGSLTLRGYGQSYFTGTSKGAHQVSWLIHHEVWPKLYVLHKCDNRKCINPDHLFLGNAVDNRRDCVKKGRAKFNPKKGENAPNSRLTNEQVKDIKNKIKSGIRSVDLAREYSVSRNYIGMIKRGSTWRNINPEIF